MQSIKNTAVSIILLFLSYGVYQVITKPLPSEIKTGVFEPLEISDPVEPGIPKDLLAEMQLPLETGSNSDNIPPALLDSDSTNEFDLPNHSVTPSVTYAENRSVDLPTSNSSDSMPNNIAPQPSYPISQASSEERLDTNLESFRPFDAEPVGQAANINQFASDSQIIQSTVMSPVAQRPTSSNNAIESAPQEPKTLAESWAEINQLIENQEFQIALMQLSRFYTDKNYSSAEEQQLLDWLDALAAKVIYSTEHHLRSMPYIIQPGDTIGSLARQWQVPAQLIYNVNIQQIPDPNELQSGVEIKLIQGPFDAEIDTHRQIMTLYLGGMYAGRFTVQSGQAHDVGEFQIVDKSAQDHLDRPYWIALNNGGSIYASESNPQQANEIALNLREAEEIFSILSATSKIKVLR